MRLRIVCKQLFNTSKKVPPKPSSIMGAQLSQKQMDELMNPLGFLKENEKGEVQEQIEKAKELKELIEKYKINKNPQSGNQNKPYELDKNGMPPEVGFKVKGPEPTRYGDWIGRGRVTDF
ncbi:unnamed protein product [Paramecium pentaurelia]|uniref:Succinate dehydrogenase assembly factor 4, mitochondrial n=1 Tax=Paramecium pentaurelia TaxID=43138 RepID=A0A8S1XNQ1_9CILI|nr:unnamed protein product [Paramecium pentaurelia]